MRFLSLFSGIEAASVAWIPLGWTCVGVAEIEPFPCKVLAHHYPDVPNLGSVTEITQEQIEALGHIDLVVGGFPCQDLSIAGKRKGLRNDDGSATRSGLFFTAMRIVEWAKPRWVLVENVPGLFSSQQGGDFAAVAGEMSGCEFDIPRSGWANAGCAVGPHGLIEWVTLDAQFCRTPQYPRAVPQRRRRVFVVRDSGDWQRREPLFFDTESLRGNPAPSREKGQEITHPVAGCATSSRMQRIGDTTGQDNVIAVRDVSPTITQNYGKQVDSSDTALGPNVVGVARNLVFTLNCNHEQPIALVGNTINRQPHNGGNGTGFDEKDYGNDAANEHSPTICNQHRGIAVAFGVGEKSEVGHCLRSGASKADKHESTTYIKSSMQVRRLTPLECHRLQGFPDDYLSQVPGASDTQMYKALGNSMAVNVMQLIGQRIQMVETIA